MMSQQDDDPEPLVRQKLGNEWADILLHMLRQKGDDLDKMSEKEEEQMWSIFSLMKKIFGKKGFKLSDRIVDYSVKDIESQSHNGNGMVPKFDRSNPNIKKLVNSIERQELMIQSNVEMLVLARRPDTALELHDVKQFPCVYFLF